MAVGTVAKDKEVVSVTLEWLLGKFVCNIICISLNSNWLFLS